ncbi:MAG: discoidin domain-containing protein, partial [Candidatus Hydrogenedentes bacterium]|nr:discoidin domain-containing protein [Candidatus Hydrogenedentota bacterium]
MRPIFKVTAICVLLGCATGSHAQEDTSEWASLFAAPPDTAKPWVYWWWLDSNVSKEGITRDLEEMKRQGIAGALIFDAGEGHTSPVGPHFMSTEWLALFKHAVLEAERVGLQLSFNLCSGWDAGGTWVTPEHAIKGLTWSRTKAKGPSNSAKELPQPPVTDGYYKDVAVLAYAVPHDTIAWMEKASVSVMASSWYQDYAPGRVTDLDPSSRWISNGDKPGMGPSEAKPEYVQFDFPEAFAAAGIHIVPYAECGPRDCQVQASQDGTTFQTICRFRVEEQKSATITFDEVNAKSFRLLITSSYPYKDQENWNVQISELQLLVKGETPQPPIPDGLDVSSAVDLTDRFDTTGRLT